jgi:phosphatidate cytidylyltransferase
VNDSRTLWLIATVLVLLGISSAIIGILRRRPESRIDPAILETFRFRVRAWWILFATLAAALLLRHWATVALFGVLSFWALREFITVTPTRPGDHRTLFWVFFLLTPLQFLFVGMAGYDIAAHPYRPDYWYGLYSILIPVYAFLLIPARIALAGDYKRFLERTAKIQCGMLICVYCLSYAPALLSLEKAPKVPAQPRVVAADTTSPNENSSDSTPAAVAGETDTGGGPRLLFFFILIAELSDALQYAWSQLPNKHVIVPAINTTRTWEGLLGGTASVMLIGALLWWATPFSGVNWWMSAMMSAVIALMGFAGSITMSAIKRDRGVKDYGTLIEGHGGVLDHIDSICFAAPVFFHFTRWWLSA